MGVQLARQGVTLHTCSHRSVAPFIRRPRSGAALIRCQANTSAYTRAFIRPVCQPSPSGGLLGRRLFVNPLETMQQAAAQWMQQVDVFMAAHIDRNKLVLGAIIAAQALLTLTGDDLLSSLRLLRMSLADLAPWSFSLEATLWCVAKAAAAAAPAAWVLRTWWAANTQLASAPAAADEQQQQQSQQEWQPFSLAGSARDAGLGPVAAAAVAAARLLLLLKAHSLLQAGGQPALGLAYVLVSWLLISSTLGANVVQQLRQRLPVAGWTAAAEAGWLVMGSSAAGLLALPAAAVYAAAWYLLQPMLAGRLAQQMVQPGDKLQLHVTLKAESGAVLDSSRDGICRPLMATAGSAASDAQQQQQGQGQQGQGQQGQGQEHQGQQEQHRLAVLLPAVCAQLPGRYRGERFQLRLGSRELAGYQNPDLVWWQPVEQVVKKLGGTPEPGHMFWYPIRDGSWVPCTVTRVTGQYAELDAGALVEGPLLLQVEVLA